jgi:hypothetical protein
MTRVIITPAPRLGVGVGLLGFCVWLFVVMLWACYELAVLAVVGVTMLVALIAGWASRDKPVKPVTPVVVKPGPPTATGTIAPPLF